MSENIAERLKNLLILQLNYPMGKEQIRAETSLYGKGMGLNSVDVVSLIVKIEDQFEIFFEAEEIAPAIKTFGSLLRVVEQKLAGNGG